MKIIVFLSIIVTFLACSTKTVKEERSLDVETGVSSFISDELLSYIDVAIEYSFKDGRTPFSRIISCNFYNKHDSIFFAIYESPTIDREKLIGGIPYKDFFIAFEGDSIGGWNRLINEKNIKKLEVPDQLPDINDVEPDFYYDPYAWIYYLDDDTSIYEIKRGYF